MIFWGALPAVTAITYLISLNNDGLLLLVLLGILLNYWNINRYGIFKYV